MISWDGPTIVIGTFDVHTIRPWLHALMRIRASVHEECIRKGAPFKWHEYIRTLKWRWSCENVFLYPSICTHTIGEHLYNRFNSFVISQLLYRDVHWHSMYKLSHTQQLHESLRSGNSAVAGKWAIFRIIDQQTAHEKRKTDSSRF